MLAALNRTFCSVRLKAGAPTRRSVTFVGIAIVASSFLRLSGTGVAHAALKQACAVGGHNPQGRTSAPRVPHDCDRRDFGRWVWVWVFRISPRCEAICDDSGTAEVELVGVEVGDDLDDVALSGSGGEVAAGEEPMDSMD
jgi:hypothetical protein